MRLQKMLLALVVSLMVGVTAMAQVTTSSLRGNVKDSTEPLMAATVVAVHQPSGTKYHALTDANGNYFINNMRVGGPYTVTVTFIGYRDHVTTDIQLQLGEEFVHDIVLQEEAALLSEVVVTSASTNPVFNSARTGAMTAISSRQLSTLPTISRSITDFTRLTPQANGASFGGRDGRMNNITIDGGAFRNNFGLSSNMMPGGSAQPISLDAIETVSVNLAPFDVRLSQFTGASVNAITKSGTNEFNGSAYTYQVGKGMSGKKVGDTTIPNFRDLNEQTYGFSVGGPIVKDKLFFFTNVEYGKEVQPYTGWYPSTDGQINGDANLARTTKADLEKMKNFLQQEFNYDAGEYDNFSSFNNSNFKILAKLDWNINDNHKLALRYNYLRNNAWRLTNPTSGPLKARPKSGRISKNSIAFSNSFFEERNTVHGFAGELNSTFGNNISNKLMVTYTGTLDPERHSPSALFPFVEIWKDGDSYMAFGHELFSFNNRVVNNTFSISDDFTYRLGKHTFLAGLRYDNIYVNNSYIREGTSFYRYSSPEQFYNYKNEKPEAFGITYGYDGKDPKGVEMNFGLLAAYLQDEIQFSPQFKLTAGLRLELPLYLNDIPANPIVDGTKLRYGYEVDLSSWPKSNLLVNPRLGFNWDLLGDRSIQLRGGVGLFSGLMPFVWFTNQPTASGTIQSPEMGLLKNDLPDNFRFNPNHYEQIKNNPDLFPYSFSDLKEYKGQLAMVAKDFRMPQLFRTNLAVDFALPFSTTLTLEALYSKDIYGILQKNANLKEPIGTLPDGRPYYDTSSKNSNAIHPKINSAIVLTNTNKGYQSSFTVQLRNNAIKGLDLSLAYTYFNAKDQTNNPGSNANSAWVNNHTYGDINDPELSYSQFAVPHRVVGSASYRIEYGNFGATTIGLYYNGSHQGRGSFLYGYDMNGDGVSGDLLYVPTGVDDTKVVFADKTDKSGNVLMSANEQYKAYMEFVDSDPYLSRRKGQFAERFGMLEPWLNRFDLKLMQEFYTTFGTNKRYTLQVSLDFINFGNLLNSSWGTYKRHKLPNSYGNVMPLTTVKDTAGANPRFNLNTKTIEAFRDSFGWENSINTGSTWKMQLGVRLLF